MKIICLMPVRNEDWILGLSVRAALMWCDEVIINLHACTDGSLSIIDDLDMQDLTRVWILRSRDAEWTEMKHRQELLNLARSHGGTHMVLVDADEVLTGNLLGKIRPMVERTAPGSILMLPWLCLRGSIDQVITSGLWAHQNASTAFPDSPEYHWATRDGYDLHHRHPMGAELGWYCPISHREAGLMHLQFSSSRRLLAKQFLYQLIEMKRWPGRRSVDAVRQMYTRTVEESENAQTSAVPDSWWAPYSHLMQYLHLEREPWQEAECRRIIAEHPGIAAGLDDFGLTNPQSANYWGQWEGVAHGKL